MGDAGDLRQGESVYRPIVAFDFDGTLTVRDSFLAFLQWRVGPAAWWSGWVRLAPALVRYVRDRDRGRLKAAAIRQFLGSAPRAEIEDAARRFAEGHARRLLRPDALRAWTRWRERGARLVIVTASPEEIIQPFASGLGVDLLIATRLAYDDRDRFAGRLDGLNCRGAEKVRRLQAEFGEDVRLDAAYGDSDGDREMLAIAEERGLKVFQGRPT
jgi:phosphatidylglycerophosphatase C